jgi:hypothetical protein
MAPMAEQPPTTPVSLSAAITPATALRTDGSAIAALVVASHRSVLCLTVSQA